MSKAQEKAHFGEALHDDNIDRAIAACIPEKTHRQTAWAFSVFQSWCDAHGEDSGIVAMEPATLENKLSRFILETHRQNDHLRLGDSLTQVPADSGSTVLHRTPDTTSQKPWVIEGQRNRCAVMVERAVVKPDANSNYVHVLNPRDIDVSITKGTVLANLECPTEASCVHCHPAECQG